MLETLQNKYLFPVAAVLRSTAILYYSLRVFASTVIRTKPIYARFKTPNRGVIRAVSRITRVQSFK